MYLIFSQRKTECIKVIYQLDKSESNFIKTRALSGIHDIKIVFPYRSFFLKDYGGEVGGWELFPSLRLL